MSNFQCIASDEKLSEMNNPKIEFYSINEALELGIDIDIGILKLEGINKDDKDAIMVCDNEDDLYEIEIHVTDYKEETNKYTQKNNVAELNWKYTKKRANELISYIKNHLLSSSEIELWNIWLDEYQFPKTITKELKCLSIKDIEEIFGKEYFEQPQCLIIKNEM